MSNKKWSIQVLFLAGLLALLALVVPRTYAAADRYVSPLGNDNPANDCSDPADPCLTIAYAISQAVANDVIELDDGVYVESGLTIDKELAIKGQGPGLTEVDANGGGDIFTVDASVSRFGLAFMTLHSSDDRALNVTGGSAEVELFGVEMTDNSGGAIAFHSSGSLTVTRSNIHNNIIPISAHGAGIYCSSAGCGEIPVLSSTISENETAGRGGAIYSYGPVTIEDSELNDNVAQAAGAIQMDLEPLMIRNSTLDGNEATLMQGGAIFADPPFYITWIPKIWGIYEVVRGGASMEAMRAAGDVLDQDGFLCIFPEAGSWASVLRPARPGTALIAVQNHVPLIPIALTGVEDVIPSWKRWRRGHVTVRIGRPFGPFTAEGRGRQRRAQLEEIGEKIMRELAELLPPEKHGVFSDDPVLRAEGEEVAEYPFHDWMG